MVCLIYIFALYRQVCLFGSAEVSVRDALRGGATDAQLVTLVRAALRNKKAQHAGEWRRQAARAAPRPRAALTRSPFARAAGGGARAGGQPPHDPHRRLAARAYSTDAGGGRGRREDEAEVHEQEGVMSHLDGEGRARMVDVGDKRVTARTALAECRVEVSARVVRLLRSQRLPKGDALCVARVAGTLAAKRTADLLPLCHPLPLDAARVHVTLPPATEGEAPAALAVSCEVRVTARTGAEMEALTGCAVAALTLYDMCKSVDRDMRITGLRLVSKTGGRSCQTPPPQPPPLRPLRGAPHDETAETYAPTNFMHF